MVYTSYTVGVDIGSGSARACVVDNDGALIATATQPIQTWQSQTGCYEQSTSDIWESVCGCVRNAVSESRIDASLVTALVFAATCSLAVFDIETHEPVSVAVAGNALEDHNVLLWMHRAASSEAELISATKHPSIRHVGGSMSPFMALAKVLWLKNNLSSEQFARCLFLDLQDAMSFMATGQFRSECSLSCTYSSTGGYGVDGTIKGWDLELLQMIGLGRLEQNDFEQIRGACKHGNPSDIGTPVGRLCDKAASGLGLPSNVIVGTGVIDCYAGWMGTVGTPMVGSQGSKDSPPTERIAIVAGTSACHILASDRSHFVDGLWGPYNDFLLPGSYTIAGGQPAVGRLVQYVVETHPAYHGVRNRAESENQTIFDWLNMHLLDMRDSQSAPNVTYLGRHIFFYGDHFGNRTPIADANMTGSIVGLTGDTDINSLAIMYYCTLEFLALQTRHIITTMTDSGHRISSIYMSGSVCQNSLFTQLLATVCDLPVIIPRYPTAAVCYGSAVLAAHTWAMARGGAKDGLWSIMSRMSRSGDVIVPDTDQYARDLLEVKYAIFLEQADRQRVFRRMIDAVRRG